MNSRALVGLVLVAAALSGCMQTDRSGGDLSLSVEGSSIHVEGATPGAEILLYNDDNATVANATADDDGGAVFEDLDPGTYHVRERTLGQESPPSESVTIEAQTTRNLTATAGVESVTVTDASPGATVSLVGPDGDVVAETTATDSGQATFQDLEPGQSYYAVEGTDPDGDVQSKDVVPTPAAPTASGGVNLVRISDALSNAEIAVYSSQGQVVATKTAGSDGSVRVRGIPPGQGYRATQTVGGAESPKSNAVEVNGLVAEVVGDQEIQVSGADANVDVQLHDADGDVVDDGTADGDGKFTFTGVPYGTGYKVRQVRDGATSPPSNAVTVAPPAPDAEGGVNEIEVSSFDEGQATVTVYDAADTAVTSKQPSDDPATIGDLPAGDGYTVTQTVNGAESPASGSVTVQGLAAKGGATQVEVSHADAGATVRLYNSSDGKVDEGDAGDDGAITFTDVTPGTGYYATQVVDGDESSPSNTVTVKPKTPDLTGNPDDRKNVLEVANLHDDAGNVSIFNATGSFIDSEEDPDTNSVEFDDLNAGPYTATQRVNDVTSDEGGPTTVSGLGISSPSPKTVLVDGVTDGATVRIYDGDGNEEGEKDASGSSVTFDDVTPGKGYSATEQIDGEESDKIGSVTVKPTGVDAAATDPHKVEVSGIDDAADKLRVLRRAGGNVVEKVLDDPSGDPHTISDVPAGLDYVAQQRVNGVWSPDSNTIDVEPVKVSVQKTGDDDNDIEVSNFQTHEDADVVLDLYRDPDKSTDGDPIRTANDPGSDPHTFENVPNGSGYFAVQTVNGSEGAVSDETVELEPAKPVIESPSPETIKVTEYEAGANQLVLLKGGTKVNTTKNPGAPPHNFTEVTPNTQYNVTQEVNGASNKSDPVDVAPPKPDLDTDPGDPPVSIHNNTVRATGLNEGAELVILEDGGGQEVGRDEADSGVAAVEKLSPGFYEAVQEQNDVPSDPVRVNVSGVEVSSGIRNELSVDNVTRRDVIRVVDGDALGSGEAWTMTVEIATSDENVTDVSGCDSNGCEATVTQVRPGSDILVETDIVQDQGRRPLGEGLFSGSADVEGLLLEVDRDANEAIVSGFQTDDAAVRLNGPRCGDGTECEAENVVDKDSEIVFQDLEDGGSYWAETCTSPRELCGNDDWGNEISNWITDA